MEIRNEDINRLNEMYGDIENTDVTPTFSINELGLFIEINLEISPGVDLSETVHISKNISKEDFESSGFIKNVLRDITYEQFLIAINDYNPEPTTSTAHLQLVKDGN